MERVEFAQLIDDVLSIGKKVIAVTAIDADKESKLPFASIEALKRLNLLGAYIPKELGGLDLTFKQLSTVCETISQFCASTGLIYAMHSLHIVTLVHSRFNSPYVEKVLKDIAARQLLTASATSEKGVSGNVRESVCGLEYEGDTVKLTKDAPIVSYGEEADILLMTCKKSLDSIASDQVLVVAYKDDYTLEKTNTWDTMGFRATCSSGHVISFSGKPEQVLPTPFSDILKYSLHPASHILWSSCWLGLTTDAVQKAHKVIQKIGRASLDSYCLPSLRYSELDSSFYTFKNTVHMAVQDYQTLICEDKQVSSFSMKQSTLINNLKISSSENTISIVAKALQIIGVAAYQNNTANSLSRHLRDAYGTTLMINNDRLHMNNSFFHIL